MERERKGVTQAQELGFHRDAILPVVGPDQQLAKFHGKPVAIPLKYAGENTDKAGFTDRQRTTLLALEQQRVATLQRARTSVDASADYEFKSPMY